MKARVLTEQDQPIWRALRLEGLELFPNAFLTTFEESEARPASGEREMLAQGNFFGVFEARALVAMGACRVMRMRATGHRAEIGPFYVTPALQGGGAGDVLMNAMKSHAQTRGAWQLELFVANDNPRARRFYERHGFSARGMLPNAALVNGKMTDDVFLVADLR